jgi:hypothetical protein
MGTLVGGVIGFGIGLFLSYFFIFPADILSIKLVNLTIGDCLRIFGGFVASCFTAWIGLFIGSLAD